MISPMLSTRVIYTILPEEQNIQRWPNYGKAYLNRALAKSEIEDYEGAIFDFDTAIELSPKEGVGYFGRKCSATSY